MAHLSLEQARALAVEHADALGSEDVPLAEALGRVTAEAVSAPFDQPPFDNSAMDGFALRAADTANASPEHPVSLGLTGESRAGSPAAAEVAAGRCARISTGALMPAGTDCVLRVEEAKIDGDHLIVERSLQRGEDVRPAGDDVKAGDIVIEAGQPIGAGEVAMLASVGQNTVNCPRAPRVAILTTGDELVPPGEPLERGQIHDSNSAMLRALVLECGGQVQELRTAIGDRLDETSAAVDQLLALAPDLLICSGGVSVGEHDHVKPALVAAGVQELFWHVAMRPGHPTWLGRRDHDGRSTLVFGLPGNPVSAYVTFHMFVAPALRRFSGRSPHAPRSRALLAEPIRKKVGNALVLRSRLERKGDDLIATPTSPNQRSHAISSLVDVDALVIVPADAGDLPADSVVEFEIIKDERMDP